MEYLVNQETIRFLWSALNEKQSYRQTRQMRNCFDKFIKDKWAFRTDLEDALDYADSRLNPNRLELIDLVKAFGMNWELICYRPNVRSISVSEYEAIRVEDAAVLFILLERLGFKVDPSYLVEALLPEIKSRKKKLFSGSELEIFWFYKCRHKTASVDLITEKGRAGSIKQTLKTESGHQITLKSDEESSLISLTVDSPKYRDTRNPYRVQCEDCGMEWYKGDPDSSANHRKEHKKRMAYLDPKPHADLIAEKKKHSAAEWVTTDSPGWKHFEMYTRARAFKREFHYDFIQWQSPKGDDDPNVNGLLLTNQNNAIVGACSFRDRTDKDGIKLWGLDWVWICPKERRTGHLSAVWGELRKRFGDFVVESPVSDEMVAFLEKKNDQILIHRPENRNYKK
ncbi:hypothetical protein [Pedobacter soli]|uniref:N-acetyltransferase ESCO zinc-finger domain-containing protein n=1 Tax=Pedobacter soli TaxID=390242 RepID=A0A1G6WLJ9_9SPHI|nr:hypothetical protein [Pedobacter soli]SDD66830.1 hypothetical protein SAMN04488024_10759 [Pedobacter soli]